MGLHSELGGTFEAWKYNPMRDGSTDSSRNKKLPPGIHKVLTGSEDSDIHYYILRPDLIANNRYITLSKKRGVIAFDPTKNKWESFKLRENSELQVVGVLLILDKSKYLPAEPTYKYLFAMAPYRYIVIGSEDKYGDRRSIKRTTYGAGVSSYPAFYGDGSAVAGGGSAVAGGGFAVAGGGSAVAGGGFSASNETSRPNNFGISTPKPPLNIPSNAEGGMRKPRYSKNKKSRKSRKSRNTRKSRKSRN